MRQIEVTFDLVEALFHTIETAVLHRDLRLEVRERRLQMS